MKIVLLNLIIMFGFVYFTSLGIKTKIHNYRCIRDARAEERAERYNKRRRARTINGGTVHGTAAPREEVKLLTHRK